MGRKAKASKSTKKKTKLKLERVGDEWSKSYELCKGTLNAEPCTVREVKGTSDEEHMFQVQRHFMICQFPGNEYWAEFKLFSANTMQVVMEPISWQLDEYLLAQKPGRLEKKRIVKQLVHCLQWLHKQGWVYGNHLCQAVLTTEGKWKLHNPVMVQKIGVESEGSLLHVPPLDMGVRRHFKGSATGVATIKNSAVLDVWSLGLLVYEMHVGHPPKKGVRRREVGESMEENVP